MGTGQSQRLLDLIPRLGITAIFGTLSFPAYLAARAREIGLDPAALGLRHIVTAGEPGAGLAAVGLRSRTPGAPRWPHVRDERRLVDDGRRLRSGRGPPPDGRRPCPAGTGRPRFGRPRRAGGRSDRRAGLDSPGPRGFPAPALPLRRPRADADLALRVWTHYAAHRDRRPPRRHAARAGSERLPAGDRRDPVGRPAPGPPLRGGARRPGRPAGGGLRGGARADRPRPRRGQLHPPCGPASWSRSSNRLAARRRAQDPPRTPHRPRRPLPAAVENIRRRTLHDRDRHRPRLRPGDQLGPPAAAQRLGPGHHDRNRGRDRSGRGRRGGALRGAAWSR